MISCKFRGNISNKVFNNKTVAVPSLMVAVHTVCPESASVKDSLKGGLSSKKTSKYPFTSTMTGVKSMSCRHTRDLLKACAAECAAVTGRVPYLRCDVTHGLADQTVLPVLLQHTRRWLVHVYVLLVVLTVVRPPNGPPDVLRQLRRTLHTTRAGLVKQTQGYRANALCARTHSSNASASNPIE